MNHAYCVHNYHGAVLAMEEINERGGLRIDDERYLMKSIFYDDRMTPDEALANVKRLVEVDKVRVLMGMTTSSNHFVFLKWLKEWREETGNDVIEVGSAFGAAGITEEYGGDLCFRQRATSKHQGLAFGRWIFETMGFKTAAVIMSKDEIGRDQMDGISVMAEKLGGEVVVKEWYTLGDLDIRAQLTRMFDAKPDIVVIGHHTSYMPEFAKQAVDVGFKEAGIPIFITGGATAEFLIEGMGAENAEGIYCQYTGGITYLLEKGAESALLFEKKIRERFGEEVGEGQMHGYDSAQILAYVLEKAGTTTDVGRIRKTLKELKADEIQDITVEKFEPFEGGFLYDHKGDAKSPVTITHMEKGKLVCVALVPP